MRTVYASKSYIRSIGGVTSCYPMGKGQGLFRTKDVLDAKGKAFADGWRMERVPGVGHDYNFGGDIWTVKRDI